MMKDDYDCVGDDERDYYRLDEKEALAIGF